MAESLSWMPQTPEYEAGWAETVQLESNEAVLINQDSSVRDRHWVERAYGINGRVLAQVKAARKTFNLVDVREEPTFETDFLLFDDLYNPKDPDSRGCIGIRPGRVYFIGREYFNEEFQYNSHFSHNQFSIMQNDNGELILQNSNPTNPTYLFRQIKPALRRRNHYGSDGRRTSSAQERIENSPHYRPPDESAPYGYYYELPILGRYSPRINGGVYLGGTSREAIVVDGDSKILNQTYRSLKTGIKLVDFFSRHGLPNVAILKMVERQTRRTMPYNAKRAEKLSRDYYNDRLINLSTYALKGAAVCRHEALLAAFFIERLIDDRLMGGYAGIERNTQPDLGGTHAWATHTQRVQRVVDPTNKFVGTKQEGRQKGLWEYGLNTDLDY